MTAVAKFLLLSGGNCNAQLLREVDGSTQLLASVTI
eukprot:CAMPEP_0174960254 /NCGR_PEP_ID=MMETSP0004_2-20121128/3609_1 /TAXON_ID=420556 /ORGANISM="Ochromonas sp., Strain CCMP1393" /LENGTH=35 /DNA_ID= /DNA_START= /DNA_END= /DNA_ORIENTATION=